MPTVEVKVTPSGFLKTAIDEDQIRGMIHIATRRAIEDVLSGKARRLWLVGQYRGKSPVGMVWDFQGVFNDKGDAVSACRNEHYFVAPIELNRAIPDTASEFPGCWYPLAEDDPEGANG